MAVVLRLWTRVGAYGVTSFQSLPIRLDSRRIPILLPRPVAGPAPPPPVLMLGGGGAGQIQRAAAGFRRPGGAAAQRRAPPCKPLAAALGTARAGSQSLAHSVVSRVARASPVDAHGQPEDAPHDPRQGRRTRLSQCQLTDSSSRSARLHQQSRVCPQSPAVDRVASVERKHPTPEPRPS